MKDAFFDGEEWRIGYEEAFPQNVFTEEELEELYCIFMKEEDEIERLKRLCLQEREVA